METIVNKTFACDEIVKRVLKKTSYNPEVNFVLVKYFFDMFFRSNGKGFSSIIDPKDYKPVLLAQ